MTSEKDIRILEADTLVEALDLFREMGFTADFETSDGELHVLGAMTGYSPKQVRVHHFVRFEGMTDPGDSSEIMALSTDDGVRGTLVISYGAKHSHDEELIAQLTQMAGN